MTTTVNFRRLLDRKQWEPCAPTPATTAVGSFIVSSNLHDQYQYYINAATLAYQYDPYEDGWQQLPSPAVSSIAAGCTGARHPWGPRAFATAGTTTTITTNLNLQRDLRGYTVRILAGPNAGLERVIASNTLGVNSVITLTSAFPTAITTASEFLMLTGRVWVLSAGATVAATSFKYYDLATNTWVGSIGGSPATMATDSKMVATTGGAENFASGTATGATATTLVNTAKSWTTNQWTNYQVRITAGTGAGQFRTISSNTGTTLTVPTWTVTPDATSVYVIEGNMDFLYVLSVGSIFRYSISGATWTTLTARPVAATTGLSGQWISGVTDPRWTNESNIINGKYIYSFRGSGSAILDRYNIATNAWDSDIPYAPKGDLLAAGNGFAYAGNYIYINIGATGRMLKYNLVEDRTEPFSQLWYTQSTLHAGDRMFDVDYVDGATTLKFLYVLTNNQNMMFRTLVF